MSNELTREVRFYEGYECVKFECKFNKKDCVLNGGGSHGIHGLEIGFFVKGEKGAIQFKLLIGRMPQKEEKSCMGNLEFDAMKFKGCYPMVTDLVYHSYTPRYKGQKIATDKCELLNGKPCYYDGSSISANDAFYTLLNGGDGALWKFLEEYYKCIFENGAYPEVVEYPRWNTRKDYGGKNV